MNNGINLVDNRVLMVSIHCITYNHEPYIRQCLEGFVMQKANFRFEAIVHDDASTDGTAAVIREFAAKYPSIIKPIFETENQYSKNDGSLARIMSEACIGKYIAFCEGDDYWTDSNKLQIQVDYMESHSDYFMCFHNAMEHWEKDEKNDHFFSNIENRDYDGVEIYRDWIVPTASVCMRRDVLNSDVYKQAIINPHFIYGDIVTFLSCASLGKIRGMEDCMCVYRKHEGGVTFQLTTRKAIAHAYHNLEIYKVFGSLYKKISFKYFVDTALYAFLMTKAEGTPRYGILWDTFRVSPLRTLQFVVNRLRLHKSRKNGK